jgi:RNA polymerase sigma-70 factor (ECF subfamily)
MTNLRIEDDREQLPAGPVETMYASRAQRLTTHTVSAENPPERSEGDLIARIKGGDVEAFYELVRPYERAVFLAALSLVKNDADAEEVAQEAILKAFKNLSRFREEAKFSTWLIQISINEAKMKLRKDRRHLYESMEAGQQNDEGDYVPKDFADWRDIPSEALEQKELRTPLTALDLTEKYRTVLILRTYSTSASRRLCKSSPQKRT